MKNTAYETFSRHKCIVEFVEHRKQYDAVCLIIDAIIEEEHTAFISAGSIYTLAYLFERGLKQQDIVHF